MNSRLYRVLHCLCRPLLALLYPARVEGKENIPKEAVVLCANHSHWVDPVLIAFALPGNYGLRIMGKKQLFENPLAAGFLHRCGVFPVDRGNSDITAVKTAIRALKDGNGLLIFPEGTRVDDPDTASHKGGAAMIAIRSEVNMVPVFVSRDKKLFHRARVVFGEAFIPQYEGRKGTAEDYQANADEIMRRVYELGGVE